VSKIVPILEQAEGLAKLKDNGKTIPASDEHRKLLSTISRATLGLSEIKSLENIITGKFVAAVKAGVSGIEKVDKTQIRTIQPKFDSKLFMDEEPELFCQVCDAWENMAIEFSYQREDQESCFFTS
jgi:hypothetical protein